MPSLGGGCRLEHPRGPSVGQPWGAAGWVPELAGGSEQRWGEVERQETPGREMGVWGAVVQGRGRRCRGGERRCRGGGRGWPKTPTSTLAPRVPSTDWAVGQQSVRTGRIWGADPKTLQCPWAVLRIGLGVPSRMGQGQEEDFEGRPGGQACSPRWALGWQPFGLREVCGSLCGRAAGPLAAQDAVRQGHLRQWGVYAWTEAIS